MSEHIHYRDGYKYRLMEDYELITPVTGYAVATDYLILNKDGRLRIKKGFPWDGASGPTFDSKSSMRASLVHDAFYELERCELISLKMRDKIDVLLHDICEQDGMWGWRANLWLWAVRKFGIFAADPGGDHPVLEAP